MLVESWEDAAIIVLAQQAQGKKVGFFSLTGKYHVGHAGMVDILKTKCDFTVACIFGGRDPALSYKTWIAPSDGPTYPATFTWAESVADLVIWSNFPKIEDPDIEAFVDTYYTPFVAEADKAYDHYDNPIGNSLGIRCAFPMEAWFTKNVTIHWLTIDRHYFPVDLRIRSYKDGIWTLIQEVFWKDIVGRDYLCIPPVRHPVGLPYCTAITNIAVTDPAFLTNLNNLTQGKALVTKNETADSLRAKMDTVGLNVKSLNIYSGPLLKYHEEEGDIYMHYGIDFPGAIDSYSGDRDVADAIIIRSEAA